MQHFGAFEGPGLLPRAVASFFEQGGLSQATGNDVGLEMNPPFFIAIIKAIVSGDVLNALGYRIRPYEVEPGATNRAIY